MDTLLVALAGGSIGAILARVLAVPGAIRDHNRLVDQTDDDLAQWVSDECVKLERELAGHQASAKQQLYTGAYLRGIAHLKEQALHRYRDQERAAQQKVKEWRDAEGALHWLLRRIWFVRPFPGLETPELAQPILDGWRGKVVAVGVGEAPVSDPTRRPLDGWAIGKYGQEAKPWNRFLPT